MDGQPTAHQTAHQAHITPHIKQHSNRTSTAHQQHNDRTSTAHPPHTNRTMTAYQYGKIAHIKGATGKKRAQGTYAGLNSTSKVDNCCNM